MDSKQILMNIKNKGMFTAGQDFDQFLFGLCKRYARIYKEILPIDDLDYVVNKLREKGLIDEDEEKETKIL